MTRILQWLRWPWCLLVGHRPEHMRDYFFRPHARDNRDAKEVAVLWREVFGTTWICRRCGSHCEETD